MGEVGQCRHKSFPYQGKVGTGQNNRIHVLKGWRLDEGANNLCISGIGQGRTGYFLLDHFHQPG